MRGATVYRVYGLHAGREKEQFFGAFRLRSEADEQIAKLCATEMNGQNWAHQYHNRGFVVRETVVDIDFEIPQLPKPRDRYVVTGSPKPNRPGAWDSTVVEVFRRTNSGDAIEKICQYERNYSLPQTFEPFRQGNREFALISRDYMKTAVLDLASGSVTAEEGDESGNSSGEGFCPVGFYVPDWWDVNGGSVIPGSEYWNADKEWPNGDFGFVWGCQWGDDSFWKIQRLDLRQVQRGIVRRDEHFGYVEFAAFGFDNPCLKIDAPALGQSAPPQFIKVSRHKGVVQATFAVEMTFDLDSGRSEEWNRLKIANFE